MDVDTTIPAEEVKSEVKDSQQTNGIGHDPAQAHRSDASDSASKEPTQKEEGEEINQSTSTGAPSSDTTAAVRKTEQPSPTDSQNAPSDSNPSNNINTEKDGQPATAADSSANERPSPEAAEARSASSTMEAAPRLPPPAPARSYAPQFKFTTFAAMTAVPTRNVTSNFLKTEKNFVLKEMATKHRRRKRKAGAGKKIIVIHPGSRILRIGRASDAYPIATPHCIARRMRVKPTTSKIANGQQSATIAFVNDKYLEEIEADLKLRMRAAKRRPVANAKSQQRSFNTSTEPERILDHNDPYKVEWTDPVAEGEFIIGQKALNLPPSKNHTFKLSWPIVGGKLNEQDYPTPRVAIADLEAIWTKVIQEDLGIEPKKFMKHYAILVIPDLYNKLYVIELVNMLLKSMQFKGVMIQQESVCACYGAGVSTACVVDIGAEVTKVSCVEDGICLPNSRAMLKYGGDDITRCFTSLINRTGFPYRDLDLTQTYDWRLMEELKEKWCTMNEADLTVQVYSFFVRKPEKQTEKYQLKVYDEVAISPMCLFFPGVIRRWIEQRETNPSFEKIVNHEDINEDAPPVSQRHRDHNGLALDVVVAQSISNCGSEERSKKLYGSIILVGGGGLVKGFDRVLEDRLFQALPATLTTVEKVEVLPSPRDMDPRLLVWKGASVMGKLEMAKELWIKPLEWDLMGRKALRDKSLFVWSKD
ncbi:hypothetical protein EDD21DRAFT_302599 [Dissophora ornata]|nr:hypothetical protein EDD21DRAFT_302599 [Dissophora ornata]